MSGSADRPVFTATAAPSPGVAAGETIVAQHAGVGADTRRFIRGSGLLLGGRGIAILLNLAVQILTVRYLAKHEYGAFAFGLGVASIGSSVVLLGLGKTIARFIPIYEERGDRARVGGTIAVALLTAGGLGISVVLLTIGLRSALTVSLVPDPLSLSLLLILIALVPINAIDHLLQTLVAIFARPRAILLRRHVLGPVLKLAAVLLVIAVSGSARLLAVGYVVGGAIGIWLYITILVREWRRRGLLEHLRPGSMMMPTGELFRFSVPLMSSELPVLLRGSLAVILIGIFSTVSAVAEYRAVYPIAGLNLMVFQAFGFLFVPLASRMFARNQDDEIRRLYWQTSAWVLVLTFPVFVVTFSLAEPAAVLLFGSAYAQSGVLLTVLAAGYYCGAVLGFSADLLRVHGRVRYAVMSDVTAAVVFVGSCLLLVPRQGALGAALSATASTIVHTLMNHAVLRLGGAGLGRPAPEFLSVGLLAIGLALALLLVQGVFAPPLYWGIPLAAAASLVLLRLARGMLVPAQTFPELLRVPLLRWLLT